MFLANKLKTGPVMAFLVLLLFLFSCTLFSSKKEMNGKVLDRDLNPIAGAEIRFVRFNPEVDNFPGTELSTATTNERGEFKIIAEQTEEGEHLAILVNKQGFQPDSIQMRIAEIEKFNEVFQNYLIILKKDE